MAKVMLVEDDNNLREIYQARLSAEGYQIVAAKDGEEALELAVKEKPDLMLLDVMMPKVSGFELLDILRSTDGIKYTKVIMMTALSQAEDKERAEKLGANRYLIKSQVTLEDMAKAVHDVLEEDKVVVEDSTSSNNPPASQPSDSPEQILTKASNVLSSSGPSPVNPISQSTPTVPDFSRNNTTDTAKATVIQEAAKQNPPTNASTPDSQADNSDNDGDRVTVAKKKIINPINDPKAAKSNLNDLLAKEEAKENGLSTDSFGDNLAAGSEGNEDIPSGSSLNNPLNQPPPTSLPG
jgi:CheY-like chemotaxis protein